MKTYIVQLEIHDDVISTRDKLSWSQARRVVLIWPRHGKVLERRVDLMLIQRYSQNQGMQLALVTRSRQVKTHARELGIPVFHSALQAQKSAWRHVRSLKAILAGLVEGRRHPSGLRLQRSVFDPPKPLPLWARLGTFSAGVAAILALALFFVPSATVKLSPLSRQQSLSLIVWANPSVAAPSISGGIPAHAVQVQVEGSDTAASSGVTQVPDRYSQGSVELTNLTDQAFTIPTGSVVLTQDDPPIRFLTLQKAAMTGQPGETLNIPIRAALPGSQGNVGMGKINALEGSQGMSVRVANPNPTSGGAERTTPAPSAEDGVALRARLVDQLRQNALDELAAQLGPGKRLLAPSALLKKTIQETSEPAEGQPGDTLRLSMQVEFEAWYVTEEDVQTAVKSSLDALMPHGYVPYGEPLKMAESARPILDNDGNVRWSVSARRTLRARVTDDQVVALVQGLSPQDAASRLQASLPLSGAPEISLFPAWWFRLPFFAYRIWVLQP